MAYRPCEAMELSMNLEKRRRLSDSSLPDPHCIAEASSAACRDQKSAV